MSEAKAAKSGKLVGQKTASLASATAKPSDSQLNLVFIAPNTLFVERRTGDEKLGYYRR